MALYSHPDKLLIKHLNQVASFSKDFITQKRIDFEFISTSELTDMVFITAISHDFGKATKFFQTYLLEEEHPITGPKNHSLISALLALKISQKYLEKTGADSFNTNLLSTFIFTSIKRHHGYLQNYDDELFDLEKKSDELVEQVNNIDEESADELILKMFSTLDISYNFSEFKKYINSKNFIQELQNFYIENFTLGNFPTLTANTKISYFYFHQLLYSVLLLSDKTDVILSELKINKTSIDSNLIESYRIKNDFHNPTSEIDKLKNKAYNAGLKRVEQQVNSSQHLYSVTLPTGLGKTITSFAIALKMQNKLNLNGNLIITIPFTSIIDQNYEVYNDILQNPESDVLLKHHHLSEPLYKYKEEEIDTAKSNFLIETWNSNVVVTTFVQLLETFYTNNKSMLLKLPNLFNSVIILDEIQNIDYKYWKLINSTFKEIGKRYNCYFILMSATQPLIFEPEKEIVELVPNYKTYYKFFNRTKIVNKLNTDISLEKFSKTVIDYILENKGEDILVVLNTKKSTRSCFEIVKEELSEKNIELYYLTTFITPFERKIIIEKIKQNQNGKQLVIISTQLIEAGVDISVDTVFREIAPLDSIIQAAGRANRYSEKKSISEIFLYSIEDTKRATNFIYGSDLILKTKNIFLNITEINENNYLQLINDYFLEVKFQTENITSKELTAIEELRFKDIGKFQLIEQRKTELIFIQLNNKAEKVWNKFVSIYSDDSLNQFEKKLEFSKIKPQFYDYVINVTIPFDKENISFDSEKELGFYVSKLNDPSQFYDYLENNFEENTGYNANLSQIYF